MLIVKLKTEIISSTDKRRGRQDHKNGRDNSTQNRILMHNQSLELIR